jgi:hypothetical protein
MDIVSSGGRRGWFNRAEFKIVRAAEGRRLDDGGLFWRRLDLICMSPFAHIGLGRALLYSRHCFVVLFDSRNKKTAYWEKNRRKPILTPIIPKGMQSRA